MSHSKPLAGVLLLGCLLMPTAFAAGEQDWPQLYGPHRDGSASGGGLLDGPVVLERLWRQPLGSGYSGVAVAAGFAVTMFADDEFDYLAAFDAATGERRWKLKLGPAYQGHDGSEDGPASTPLIHGERVYAVTPKGLLIAVDLRKGKQRWKVSLKEAFDAVEPDYGFTTSPLMVGDTLVVQAGGPDGHGVCGFDPGNGKLRWGVGEELAAYRSPVLLGDGRREHLVSVTSRAIRGIDPDDGTLLWEHTVDEDTYSGIGQIVPAGPGRFLLTGWEVGRLFELVPRDEGWKLEERWTTSELKGTYAPPVYHDGHFYGYSGNYLTCVDGSSGERVWKSRPPGEGSAIRVDDRLVVWAKAGMIHLAPASTEGYTSLAEIRALQEVSLTPPAFADGTVFVRNLEEIAAIAIRPTDRVRSAEPQGIPAITAGTPFGRFLADLTAATDTSAAIDAWFDAHQSFPVVENERVVHFVYRGPGDDVGIVGSLTPDGSESLLRAAGTDLFYRTYEVEPGSRIEYSYIVDFGDDSADPRNPAVASGTDGKRSEVVLPGWVTPEWVMPASETPAGKTERFSLHSPLLNDSREIEVYLPRGYETAADRAYPLLLAISLEGIAKHGRLPEAIERLRDGGIEPPIVAYVPLAEDRDFAWWSLGYSIRRDAMARALADEIVPELEQRYRVRKGRQARAILGVGWGAYPALWAALSRPDTFGSVAAVSTYTYAPLNQDLQELVAKKSGPTLDVYLGWGRYDYQRDVGARGFLREAEREIGRLLADRGHRVTTREIPAGTGWGSWWVHFESALGARGADE